MALLHRTSASSETGKSEKKKRHGKLLLRLLCSLLALLCIGCGGAGYPTGTESGTDGKQPGRSVREVIAEFGIVYPEAATAGETAAVQKLFRTLNGTKLPQSDFVGAGETVPANSKEILVGKTNRISSIAAVTALVREKDWSVSIGQDEIIIAARHDEAVMEAVEFFLATVLDETYSVGYRHDHSHVYTLSTFFGLDAHGVRIVYAEDMLKESAEALQTYILEQTGEAASIVREGAGTLRFAVDTTMDVASYRMTVAVGNVRITGGSMVAVEEAVKKIVVDELGAKAEGFEGNSTIPVTMTDLRKRQMQLVWHDEFDGDSFNSLKWNLVDRMYGGNVTTTTSDKNITLSDGQVLLQAQKENNGKYSTNKTLSTYGRMSFLYGYIEIRARVPFVPGAFQSFWFQSAPEHRTAPYMTEVDMFEPYFYGFVESAIHKWYLTDGKDHLGTYAHDWCEPQRYTLEGFEKYWNYWNYSTTPTLTAAQKQAIEAFNKEYHTWGFGWTSTEMYFTLDGKEIGQFDLSVDFGEGIGNGKTGMSGFVNDPLFINFTNWIAEGDGFRFKDYTVSNDTGFPLTFEIDWIRLYQTPSEGGIWYDYKQ